MQKTYSTNTNLNNILDTLCQEYEKEYYLQKSFTHIFKYLNIFKYLKIIKSKVIATSLKIVDKISTDVEAVLRVSSRVVLFATHYLGAKWLKYTSISLHNIPKDAEQKHVG